MTNEDPTSLSRKAALAGARSIMRRACSGPINARQERLIEEARRNCPHAPDNFYPKEALLVALADVLVREAVRRNTRVVGEDR